MINYSRFLNKITKMIVYLWFYPRPYCKNRLSEAWNQNYDTSFSFVSISFFFFFFLPFLYVGTHLYYWQLLYTSRKRSALHNGNGANIKRPLYRDAIKRIWRKKPRSLCRLENQSTRIRQGGIKQSKLYILYMYVKWESHA